MIIEELESEIFTGGMEDKGGEGGQIDENFR